MKKIISIILAVVLTASVLMTVSSAAGITYEYQTWKQNDTRWANFKIGITETIEGGGCALTSVAMAMVHSGAASADPKVFNPLVLAKWMKANGGFTQSGSYYSDGLMVWTKISDYNSSFSYCGNRPLSGSNADKAKAIQSYMNQGYVLVVDTGYHYVLADRVEDSYVAVFDPGWAPNLTGSLFRDYGSSVCAVELFKGPSTNISYGLADRSVIDVATVSGDFNGDGNTDVASFYSIKYNQSALDILYSDGKKFKNSTVWNGQGFTLDSFASTLTVCDVNGDGKDDICAFYDYGKGSARIFVWLATESKFELKWNYWEMTSGFYVSDIKGRIVAGDYNGDGLGDICAVYDYGKGHARAFVWTSNKTKFSLNWNYWELKTGFYSKNITDLMTSGDFDGDGIDDVLAFYDYGKGQTRAFVWQSQKTSFWLNWNYWYMASGFPCDRIAGRVTSGDYNGDGKTDVPAMFDYGRGQVRNFVWRSVGSGFNLDWNWWYIASGFSVESFAKRVTSGDVNGDGSDDIVGYYRYADGSGRMFVYQSTGNNFSLKWDWWTTPKTLF